METLFW